MKNKYKKKNWSWYQWTEEIEDIIEDCGKPENQDNFEKAKEGFSQIWEVCQEMKKKYIKKGRER